MKNFSSGLVGFLAGLFVALLLVGGAAAWYFSQNPAGTVSLPMATAPVAQPQAPQATPPAEVHYPAPQQDAVPQATTTPIPTLPAGVPSRALALDGQVILPPLLQEGLRNDKEMLISVRAFLESPNAKDSSGQVVKNLIRVGDDIHVQGFPYHYHLLLRPGVAEQLATKPSVKLFLWAKLCFGRDVKAATSAAAPVSGQLDSDCTNDTVPSVWGWLVEKMAIPATPAKKAEEVVQVPPVVLRRLSKKYDPVACERTGGSISGRVQATPAFLKAGPLPKKFVLIGAPTLRRPPPPFTYQDDSIQVPAADVPQSARYGIIRQSIVLKDATPVPFTVKIPEAFRNDIYGFLMSACKDGQSDDECAAYAFPITPGRLLTKAASVTRLIPAGFEQARCGMKDHLFYLHRMNEEAPRATEATVYTANPPEIIEGAGF